MAKSRLSSKYDSIAHSLVQSIMDIDETEEEFTPTKNYVLNQLMGCHYMNVDSQAIKRSWDGIILKFQVHSQHHKAERLKNLSDLLLDSQSLKDKGELKWSFLSLLLCLSQHPARDDLPPCSSYSEIEQNSDNLSVSVDWIQELMNRSLQTNEKDETLSEWSDDEMGNPIDPQDIQNSLDYKDVSATRKGGNYNRRSSEESHRRNSLFRDSHFASCWLEESLHKPYWNYELLSSEHKLDTTVSEYAVMRECLWTLLVPSSGFVFRFNGNDFDVHSIRLSTISNASLEQLLKPIKAAALKLLSLREWLKRLMRSFQNKSNAALSISHSYSEGLRRWIHYFSSKVIDIEKMIFLQDETHTLLWLLEKLDPFLSELNIIYKIHSRSFSSDLPAGTNGDFKLLSLLIQGFESGCSASDRFCLLFLLKFALKTHLRALQSILWQSNTLLPVYIPLFGINMKSAEGGDRNKNENMYEVDPHLNFNLRGLSFLRLLQRPLIDICQLREVVHDLDLNRKVCSSYLEDLVSKEIDVWLSAPIQPLAEQGDHVVTGNPPVESCSTPKEGISNSNNVSAITSNEINLDIEMETLQEESSMGSTKNFETLEEFFLNEAFRGDGEDEVSLQDEDCFNQFTCKDTFQSSNGLEYLLQRTLFPIVQKRSQEISEEVLDSLVSKHRLMQQLKMFKAVFLLEPEARMGDFYSFLFHSIDNKDVATEIELSQNLQECISVLNSEWARCFGISVDLTTDSSTTSLIQMFQSLSINKVDLWPLSLIVDSDAHNKYNRLFVFCLLLRRASSSLEQLHFKEIGSFGTSCSNATDEERDDSYHHCSSSDELTALSHRVHRLQLLRLWLFYLVQILRDYFFTTAVVPFSCKVNELVKIRKFGEFRMRHKTLLDEVCRDCFLNHKVSPLQKVFNQVFCTVENVRNLWLGSPNEITEKKLENLQNQYCSCHRFIGEFFSVLSQNQFIPLIEGLAQNLSYNRPT